MSDSDLFTDEPAPSADIFTDEPAPKTLGGFAGNAVSNALRAINPVNIVKSGVSSLKQGLYDIPKAALETSVNATKGLAHMAATGETPDAGDLKQAVDDAPIVQKTHEMVDPIAKDPAGYAYKNPIDTAMLLAAPALGLAGVEGPAKAIPEAEAPPAAAPESLPITAPGAKTGAPHALFAYNDNYGPGGAARSIYNVFGDPEHPAVQAVGHGSSVTSDILEKNGIPVTGREPRAANIEPISAKPATEEPMETMYHGTTEAAANGINKNGFNSSGPNKDMVFITKDKNAAMDYAKYAAEHYEKGGKPAVIEMKVPRSQLAASHDLEIGRPLTTEQANRITGHPERTLDDYLNKTGGNKGYFVLDNNAANQALKNAAAKPAEPLIPMGAKEPPAEPASRLPPDPNAPPPPAKPAPSIVSAVKGAIPQSVKDYISSKAQAAAAKPGFIQNAGKYLKEEANKLDAHDLGLQMRQVQKMGSGYKGLEQANQLIDYARNNGYLRPGLSDLARRGQIEANLNKFGENVGAIRKIANSRGAPDLVSMRSTLEKQLTHEFGIDAPTEIQKVLAKFDKKAKEDPTFSGMADLATELNKAKTPTKDLAQHPGPTTEGANIVSRENNNGIRGLLKPEENNFYTQNLRDFGAHKKLEQVTAGAARRGLTARTNQRGVIGRMFQEALDRGGYRVGSRIASGTGDALASGRVHSLPEFFEELGHQSDDAVDDAVQGMSRGGVVPDDVKRWVSGRAC